MRRKAVRNSLVSFLALVIVFLLAGVLYVKFSGPAPATKQVKSAQTADIAPKVIKPTPPNPNTPESAAIESITSPTQPGSNVSLLIRTKPTSVCSPSVIYNNVASTDSGLAPKTADDYGTVSWTWTVEKSVPVGQWPVKVTCVFNKTKSAVVQTYLQVSPASASNNQN
jgi:hypothetical protein